MSVWLTFMDINSIQQAFERLLCTHFQIMHWVIQKEGIKRKERKRALELI